MKQTVQFNLRCSPEELEKIRIAAKREEKSVNRYLIDSALNGEPLPLEQVKPVESKKPVAPQKRVEQVVSTWKGSYDKKQAAK